MENVRFVMQSWAVKTCRSVNKYRAFDCHWHEPDNSLQRESSQSVVIFNLIIKREQKETLMSANRDMQLQEVGVHQQQQ